jgi:hypothetical protein
MHGDTAPGRSKTLVERFPQVINGKARDKAGKSIGVSGSMIDRASKVLKDGVPELVKAVEDGRISVTKAAKRQVGFLPLADACPVANRPLPGLQCSSRTSSEHAISLVAMCANRHYAWVITKSLATTRTKESQQWQAFHSPAQVLGSRGGPHLMAKTENGTSAYPKKSPSA